MMKRIPLLLSTLFTCTFLSAQEETHQPFLKPQSVELFYGVSFYRDAPLSLEEMKKVAPGSVLLNKDYSDFDEANLYFYGITGNSLLGVKAQFIPYSKKKKEYLNYSTIHIGFAYGEININGPSYLKEERNRFDTLVASNGSSFYLDSASKEFAQFNWSEKLVGIDIGQTFHTDDKRIFSCWAGYGIQLAMGLDTRFRGYYSYSEYNIISASDVPNSATTMNYSDPNASYTIEGKTETIRTKNVFVPRVYFPLGVQVRFSRKENFWNKLALTAEARMSMDIQPVPNSVMLTRFSFNQTAGLKYYFAYNTSK